MLQISCKYDDTEEVVDLVEAPEIVLLQFCDLILRKWDLRNPEVRNMLREMFNALKAKAEKKPDGPAAYSPYSLEEQIAHIEGLLDQLDQE